MQLYFIVFVWSFFGAFKTGLTTRNDRDDSVYELSGQCKVPKNAPYIWVKAVTKTAIVLGITDPNEPGKVSGFSVYYWGLRFGVNSTIDRRNRDFGQRTFSAKGPYVIKGLKPKFVYCADITAFNLCGHGPFCVSCFENVLTWDTKEYNESRTVN